MPGPARAGNGGNGGWGLRGTPAEPFPGASHTGVASGPARGPLRTLRCMQGMLSGGLLVAVFLAVAATALLVLVRLWRISGPGRPKAGPGA